MTRVAQLNPGWCTVEPRVALSCPVCRTVDTVTGGAQSPRLAGAMSRRSGGRPSLRRVVVSTSRQFWSETDVGGLSHAHSARLRPLRLLWLGLFVAGLTLTVLDVHHVVTDFLGHPYVTELDVVHESALPFPAVTVCSQSQLDCLRLTQLALSAADGDPLRRLLRESGCLTESGTSCHYLWDILPGLASRRWIDETRPYCLRCGMCSRYWQHVRRMEDSEADKYSDLFVAMGCNSTCMEDGEGDSGGKGGSGGRGRDTPAVGNSAPRRASASRKTNSPSARIEIISEQGDLNETENAPERMTLAEEAGVDQGNSQTKQASYDERSEQIYQSEGFETELSVTQRTGYLDQSTEGSEVTSANTRPTAAFQNDRSNNRRPELLSWVRLRAVHCFTLCVRISHKYRPRQ